MVYQDALDDNVTWIKVKRDCFAVVVRVDTVQFIRNKRHSHLKEKKQFVLQVIIATAMSLEKLLFQDFRTRLGMLLVINLTLPHSVLRLGFSCGV